MRCSERRRLSGCSHSLELDGHRKLVEKGIGREEEKKR